MWTGQMRSSDSAGQLHNCSRESLLAEMPPEVVFRKKNLPVSPGGASHRHSYHGGLSPSMNMASSFNTDHRFSHVPNGMYQNNRKQLSSQRSLDDWERSRCARKRLSGNFSLLSVLPEDMNSNDGGMNGRPMVDMLQQGPDIQDSPRSSVASGPTTKREDLQHGHMGPPHMMPQGGIPLQGQVLVDPSTGQHYIVPQTAFYQTMQPMQPMYYPPPQPTPMYYPYGQHVSQQGYVNVMQPQGQVPQGAYAVSMQSYNQPPRNNFSTTPPFRHGYAQNVASTEDVSRRDGEERRFDDHPPQSPTFSTHTPPNMGYPQAVPYGQMPVTSFAQQYRQHQQQQQPFSNANNSNLRCSPNSQPEDPESGRDGFRRDVTRSSAEFAARSSGEFNRQGSGEFQRPREGGDSQRSQPERTPLYGGPPQWWGRPREEGDSLTDFESKRPQRVSPPIQSTASDSEASRQQPQMRQAPAAKPVRMDIDFNEPVAMDEQPKPKPATARAVRLDFDLSKTMPEEEELRERMKAVPRVPATAFTVTFDSPTEGVSLQDAARKSAQARRVLGRRPVPASSASTPRSVPAQPEQHHPPTQGEASNKNYLLNKLLHGPNASESDAGAEMPEMSERKDNDLVSEAGTFVVDTSARVTSSNNMMLGGRIVEDSDDDTSSDSGSSRTASPVRPAPAQPKPSNEDSGKGDILQGLCKLRQMAGISPPTAVTPQPQTPLAVPIRPSRASEVLRPSTAQVAPVLQKRVSLGQQPPGSAPSTGSRCVLGASARAAPHSPSNTTTNPFRRGDGGRFSMRGGQAGGSVSGQASPLPQSGPKRPPFRAGGAPIKQAATGVQREQEMNAWLRRKDYNPMKAAAEAKKAKDVKSSLTDISQASLDYDSDRGDQFTSNRSISFHVGPAGMKPRQNECYQLIRNRSEESLAQEDADQASQRIVAEYSRGVVKDLNRLSEQSSHATGKQLSGLARAVDMLSQKCKKSIELIRNQNKGCLSVSVEDLLAAAAEPPRDDECLNEQLDRLSDAFDAVQRYLEQYSLDGHQSPIPEFNEEPETGSVVSGFSGFSLRSHQLSQERTVRGPISGSLANGLSPKATAYRSRILANRSPASSGMTPPN